MNQKRLPVFFSTLILLFSVVLAACSSVEVPAVSAGTKKGSSQIKIDKSERLLLHEATLDLKYGTTQAPVVVIEHMDKTDRLLLHEATLDQKYGTTQAPVVVIEHMDKTDRLLLHEAVLDQRYGR